MTRESAIKYLIKDKEQRGRCLISEAIDVAIKALEQEPYNDIEEIREVINCDADAETESEG